MSSNVQPISNNQVFISCMYQKCTNKAEKKCTDCKSVYYCSRSCQAKDWKENHKQECPRIQTIVKMNKIKINLEKKNRIISITCHALNCSKSNENYKKCPCATVYYCSRTCQKNHWDFHKHKCEKIRAKNENTNEEKETKRDWFNRKKELFNIIVQNSIRKNKFYSNMKLHSCCFTSIEDLENYCLDMFFIEKRLFTGRRKYRNVLEKTPKTPRVKAIINQAKIQFLYNAFLFFRYNCHGNLNQLLKNKHDEYFEIFVMLQAYKSKPFSYSEETRERLLKTCSQYTISSNFSTYMCSIEEGIDFNSIDINWWNKKEFLKRLTNIINRANKKIKENGCGEKRINRKKIVLFFKQWLDKIKKKEQMPPTVVKDPINDDYEITITPVGNVKNKLIKISLYILTLLDEIIDYNTLDINDLPLYLQLLAPNVSHKHLVESKLGEFFFADTITRTAYFLKLLNKAIKDKDTNTLIDHIKGKYVIQDVSDILLNKFKNELNVFFTVLGKQYLSLMGIITKSPSLFLHQIFDITCNESMGKKLLSDKKYAQKVIKDYVNDPNNIVKLLEKVICCQDINFRRLLKFALHNADKNYKYRIIYKNEKMDYFFKTFLVDGLNNYTMSQIQWVKQEFFLQDNRFTFGIIPKEKTLLNLFEKTGLILKKINFQG